MPRYKNQRKARLAHPMYDELFDRRKINFLEIRRTMVFEELKGRTFSTIETREWTFGDSLYKLSYQYYNTIEFWWVIALVNNKPTDAHFKFGDMITIPANPDIFNNLIGNQDVG